MAKMPKWIKATPNKNKLSITISIKWWAYPWLLWKEFHKNFKPSLTLCLFKKDINISFLIYPYVLWFIAKTTFKAAFCEVK
jgi:hypothetical protein